MQIEARPPMAAACRPKRTPSSHPTSMPPVDIGAVAGPIAQQTSSPQPANDSFRIYVAAAP